MVFGFFGLAPCRSGSKGFCGRKRHNSTSSHSSEVSSSSRTSNKSGIADLFKKKSNTKSHGHGHCCHGRRCSARHSKRRVNAAAWIAANEPLDGGDNDGLPMPMRAPPAYSVVDPMPVTTAPPQYVV
eukprot:Clim_evm3s73 gene=Clim_evmTU3s73